MTANIEIVYAERASVLRIANAGVRFRPPVALVGKTAPYVPLDRKMVWIRRENGGLAAVLFKPGVRGCPPGATSVRASQYQGQLRHVVSDRVRCRRRHGQWHARFNLDTARAQLIESLGRR